MALPVRFLFDCISPFAYLASTQIEALARRHGREVDAVPVLFAGLLNATGGVGPAEIPVKREYMFKHAARLAAQLGVPIEAPATHPFNPLLALRAVGCVSEPAARMQMTRRVCEAVWVHAACVEEAEAVATIATAAGLDGAALAREAASDEAKQRLRRATEEALAEGVFGVPSVVADGEVFWGVDSLPLLESFLSGHVVLDEAKCARWQKVVPSAVRRRPAAK